MNDAMWKDIADKLPIGMDQDSKRKRKNIFMQMDINGNGYLSLAEIDKGLRDILRIDHIFDCKPAIMRAYQVAKNHNSRAGNSNHKQGGNDDYVEFNEFKVLLVYLRKFFEYFQMFMRIDKDQDRRISLEEFVKSRRMIEGWGIQVGDPEKVFRQIDRDNGGMILFEEFCDWAAVNNLDLEDDDDFDDPIKYQQNQLKKEKERQRLAQKREQEIREEEIRRKELFRQLQEQNRVQYLVKFRQKYGKEKVNSKRFQLKIKKKLGKKFWENLAKKLPSGDDENMKREEIFRMIDVNDNGFLSLAEIDKGLRDVLEIDSIFDCKPCIIRAYQASKDISSYNQKEGQKIIRKADRNSQEYVERSEFRYLILYLRRFFEYFQMFDAMDSNQDRRLSQKEFVKAVPIIKKWGFTIGDPIRLFNEIDQDGAGMILFEEFCDWAATVKLDLEDDDDFDDSMIAKHHDHIVNSKKKGKKYIEEQKIKQLVLNQLDICQNFEEFKRQEMDKQHELKQRQELNRQLKERFIQNRKQYLQKFKQKYGSDYNVDIKMKVKLTKEQWKLIESKLPQNIAEREEVFRLMDMNGNGFISLAEFDKGIRDILKIDSIFECKPVILRAFNKAKDLDKKGNSDYVEKDEFDFLIQYLQLYFKVWQIFDEIDSSGDRRISFMEFKMFEKTLKEEYKIKCSNIRDLFDSIDTDQAGMILFDEFAAWAVDQSITKYYQI